ncbi:MAG: DNA-packaging protein [Candidatus Pacebacteria bacterium]|nr:DNA-packaging protein [Candidatus Paceibacterota bacterium]
MKRGRPTKYSPKIPPAATTYTNKCLKEGVFPTIEGLSAKLKLGTRTLYDWEKLYPDFSQTMDNLRDAQRELLITNGLQGNYNTRFSMFLLKASHGMREKEPLVDSSQNNFSNISPELLADALTLMRSREE